MTMYSINPAAGVTISATAASSNTALTGYATVRQVKLSNAGTSAVFVRFGPVSQTAVVTDFCILGGEVVVVSLPGGTTNIGAICGGSDSTTLHVSPCVTNE